MSTVGLHQLVDRPLHRHPVDLARVVEPAHVVAQPEDRAAGGRLVAANTLEDARSIVHDMTHHVDGRVLPGHELAVAPDPGGWSGRAIGHCSIPLVVQLDDNGCTTGCMSGPRSSPAAVLPIPGRRSRRAICFADPFGATRLRRARRASGTLGRAAPTRRSPARAGGPPRPRTSPASRMSENTSAVAGSYTGDERGRDAAGTPPGRPTCRRRASRSRRPGRARGRRLTSRARAPRRR